MKIRIKKIPQLLNINAYGGPLFAFGGDLQTNSSDFPTGLTHIDVGGSHEENPYEGVLMGVDKQGNPNLVEENEVIYDDYVFSARIPVDEETKKKFHIGKKKEITYADLAKRLEKEISERPNDPLSKAGFKAQMEALQENQERQKQEMEAERARQAFEALSPEEQVSIMNRANQEEQIAQQAVVPSRDAINTMVAPQMQAMGGRKYDYGGPLLDTVVGMEDPTMGTLGGIVVTPKNNEKKAALQINPLTFINAARRREEAEERDNRDKRIEEYLDRLEDWLDTGRRNRSKIHYYAPGGKLDNDWYNTLAPEYKWLVDQYKFTDANSLGRMPIAFQNALVKLYQRMQAVKDNPEYSDFSLAAANSNNFIKDDDFYTSLKNKGYDSFGFYDLTPEQWQSVYNDYLERHTTPQALAQESPEMESKKERVSLKDRIDRIIDNISRRRKERKARRAERRENRQQTREERRQARLEAKEQDRLEKEQIHQLRALAKEEEAKEKAERKQQKQEQKEQVKAAKEALSLDTSSPQVTPVTSVTPVTPIVTSPQSVLAQDDFPKRNSEYYNNGESTTMQEVTVTPPRTQQSTATIPEEGLQDYTSRDGILTSAPPAASTPTDNDVTTIPTPQYWYNGQGYDDDTYDAYLNAIYEDAKKYGVDTYNYNTDGIGGMSLRSVQDIIDDIDAARRTQDNKAFAVPEETPQNTALPTEDNYLFGSPQSTAQRDEFVEELMKEEPIRTTVVGKPEPVDATEDPATQQSIDAYNYNLLTTPDNQLNPKELEAKEYLSKSSGPTINGDVESTDDKDISEPKDNWMRYAGLAGPAVGLGMMAAGIGKPDYSRLDAALASLGEPTHADWKSIGNYLTYRPMDIWYEQNRMNANARATDRTISNNAAPLGTKMAGLLANSYNSQIASGDLYRKALEYNDAKRAQVEDFNRGTNQFNAQAYNQNSMFNANADNAHKQARAKLGIAAAQTRLDNDAGWYNSLYGNVGNLFKGIGDLGRDKNEKDWLKWLVDRGVFGQTGNKANGGKLKTRKKRGFTY